MKVLIACEESGIVRDAFLKLGHDAWSCDLLPTDREGPHLQGDALHWVKREKWDLMIAHPPCTYLSNSGNKHLYRGFRKENGKNPARWRKMREGALFFKELLNADVPMICIENPIMTGHAKQIIGVEQDQTIQPWMFGHMESKATCLWLKNLPPLKETNNVYDEMMKLPRKERERIHFASPGPDRAKLRSRTFPGIAAATAEQFGGVA
jgi:hypothetical protein